MAITWETDDTILDEPPTGNCRIADRLATDTTTGIAVNVVSFVTVTHAECVDRALSNDPPTIFNSPITPGLIAQYSAQSSSITCREWVRRYRMQARRKRIQPN